MYVRAHIRTLYLVMFLCGSISVSAYMCMYICMPIWHWHMTTPNILFIEKICVFFVCLFYCFFLDSADLHYSVSFRYFFLITSWINLFMRPATERRCYNATSSPIGWAQTQNEPCKCMHVFYHCPVFLRDIWWRHQMETFSALLAFVRGINRSPVVSPHKSQWRGAVMFSLICAWKKWSNKQSSDLIRHRAHYDVTVICQNGVRSIAASAEGITSTCIGLFFPEYTSFITRRVQFLSFLICTLWIFATLCVANAACKCTVCKWICLRFYCSYFCC